MLVSFCYAVFGIKCFGDIDMKINDIFIIFKQRNDSLAVSDGLVIVGCWKIKLCQLFEPVSNPDFKTKSVSQLQEADLIFFQFFLQFLAAFKRQK